MEKKTAYVASRFAMKENVREIYSKLEMIGYSVSGDWTSHRSVKPYTENQELSAEYAIEDLEAVRRSDVFILISDAAGTGMHTEFGAAIDHYLEFKKPVIYVIGKHLDSSMFFFHTSVRRKDTTDEVIEELKTEA